MHRALFLFALLASGARAQSPDSSGVYDRADQAPAPMGGVQAVMARAVYPPEAAAEGVQGRMFVQAVVSASGEVTGAEGLRCPDARLCEAAVAAVLASPFEPGRVGGEAVAARVTLPVAFVLAPEAASGVPEIAPLAAGQSLGRAAPEATPNEDGIYETVDVNPVLIGGLRALQERVRYPEASRRAREQGKVFVQFVVSRDGRVERAECIRPANGQPVSERLCLAALRAVGPSRFEPGLVDGRPVRVRFTIPVDFKLR